MRPAGALLWYGLSLTPLPIPDEPKFPAMTLNMLLPLLYLLLGFTLARLRIDIRKIASTVLMRVAIPYVVIHNMVFSQQGTFVIMAAIVAIMAVMLGIGWLLRRDAVEALNFSYLNIGWMGLPIAVSLFGNDAAAVMIAAYVGSSLFGNTVSAALLAPPGSTSWPQRLRTLLLSPAFLAMITGLLLSPFAAQLSLLDQWLYEPAKVLMSLLGMGVLGMWLAHARISRAEVSRSVLLTLQRVVALLLVMWSAIQLGTLAGLDWVQQYARVLYLICLLPPAAIIVILETHYLRTGRSASSIAVGTCISVILIVLYAVGLRLLG